MKKKITAIILIVTLVLALALPMASVGANPGPGIVGLWHLDDGAGQVASDSSGNGNDGQLGSTAVIDTNDPAWVSPGKFGDALSFDGSNDYVDFGDISTANWTNLTTEAWVYWDGGTVSGYAGVYYKAYHNDIGRLLINSAGKVLVQNGNGNFFSGNNGDVPTNQWSHIAYVYDQTTGQEYIYVDGDLKGQQARSGDIAQNSTSFRIGYGWGGSTYYVFSGLIDEVRIWDEALSAEQIEASSNDGIRKEWLGVDDPEDAEAWLGDHIGVHLDVIVTSTPMTVVDTLPGELRLRVDDPSTFMVDGAFATPVLDGNTVSYTFTQLGAHTIDMKIQVVEVQYVEVDVENLAKLYEGADTDPLASDTAIITLHPYEGFSKEILVGDEVVPLETDVHWLVVIGISNIDDEIDTMEDVVVKDRLGGDLELDGFWESKGELVTSETGKTNKVHLTWDLEGDLANEDSAWLVLDISTDINPGGGKKNGGHQEYTSPGWNDLNSGAVVKFIDSETGFQLSAHTPPLSVLAEEGAEVPSPIGLLYLNEKNPSDWTIVEDGAAGILGYNLGGPTFDYVFVSSGLEPETEYSLIYYADPWAGNNPGALIATMTTDVNGNVSISGGSVDLNTDLPNSADGNYLDGAKIWLVLSGDYNSGTASTGPMTGWQPTEYLFEHNLITYNDTDVP